MVEWVVPSVLAVVGVALSTGASYFRNDKDLSNRVTALEVQQSNDGQRLERIEGAVGRVDAKIDKVLDHMLERK